MAVWDDEGARLEFLNEKYVSLGIDWVVDPTFWSREGGAVGLDWLPIPAALQQRFERWWYWCQNRHMPGYDLPDRENPPFPDLEEFAAEGHAIAAAIKRELPDWRISYRDYLTGRDIDL